MNRGAGMWGIIFITYTAGDLKLAGFENVISAMSDSGFLIIRAKERLPDRVPLLERFELPYVFRRK